MTSTGYPFEIMGTVVAVTEADEGVGGFELRFAPQAHPTPPRRFHSMLWRSPINVMAFPIDVMAFPIKAFPIHGMAPGLAAAPGHGQVALGTKEVARPWGAQNGGPRATSFAPSATWPWPGTAARPGVIP